MYLIFIWYCSAIFFAHFDFDPIHRWNFIDQKFFHLFLQIEYSWKLSKYLFLSFQSYFTVCWNFLFFIENYTKLNFSENLKNQFYLSIVKSCTNFSPIDWELGFYWKKKGDNLMILGLNFGRFAAKTFSNISKSSGNLIFLNSILFFDLGFWWDLFHFLIDFEIVENFSNIPMMIFVFLIEFYWKPLLH